MAPPFARANPPPAAEVSTVAGDGDGGSMDGVDPDELWCWDTRGYLVIPGVMDEVSASHSLLLPPATPCMLPCC